MDLSLLLNALILWAGYNTAIVSIGAALLGAAGGAIGSFILLRRQAMVSDAISHATLPGVALAFIIMAAAGGDGRFLPGLLLGAAVTAGLGLLAVEWMGRRTRLPEDAAIGAVLSVTFGIGIVALTVIQTMGIGKPAGLEGFLLGNAAAMLASEAVMVLVGAALASLGIFLFQRRMLITAFDPAYARSVGIDLKVTDRVMMALALGITVIGLKLVGLVLIVALMIIPPVAARFWTERADHMVLTGGGLGALGGYLGTAISASGEGLPTGSIIVLVLAGLFVLSLLFAPARGLVAAKSAQWRYRQAVRQRQGLLAIAGGKPVHDRSIRRALQQVAFLDDKGSPTEAGHLAAGDAALDEARWTLFRHHNPAAALARGYDGITSINQLLTADEIAWLDRQMAPKANGVPG
ncbi:MAG: metal ABC transporter permease [Alphaproteobacteria bacterium]|nr:metal ABC transporter permease [Alphaproteobacteria bacterium SS10]